MRYAVSILLLCCPAAMAADRCPWINAATAEGVLGGPLSGATVVKGAAEGDVMCTFTRRDGSREMELRISTDAHAARCHTATVPVKAIGNEAVACSDNAGEQSAELIVSRVREHPFSVRMAVTGGTSDSAVLREKARKIAEQVAGILF